MSDLLELADEIENTNSVLESTKLIKLLREAVVRLLQEAANSKAPQ